MRKRHKDQGYNSVAPRLSSKHKVLSFIPSMREIDWGGGGAEKENTKEEKFLKGTSHSLPPQLQDSADGHLL